MQQALDLALKGWPMVQPNPMVGCVIVHGGQVVASGYHAQFGGPHAEVHAVQALPPGIDPAECTVYVTLEPCSHFGKTPPCADLLVRSKFSKVVVASTDPNPLVAGRGIEKLKAAGIKVEQGVLENEARDLNKRFYCFHQEKRPYITLKWALSADGFVSRDPLPADRSQNKITRKAADLEVHRMRSENMAIMVGKGTVLADDPQLTSRLVQGPDPIRVLVDRKLEIPAKARVFDKRGSVLVFNELKEEDQGHVRFVLLKSGQGILEQVLQKLHEFGIQTLFVEGGTHLLTEFLTANLWDEALVFQNPDLFFDNGIRGPEFPLKNTFELVGEDKLYHHYRNEALPAKGPLSKEIF